MYKELLSTPFDKVDKYWEPFEAFSSKLPTELLGDEEELNVCGGHSSDGLVDQRGIQPEWKAQTWYEFEMSILMWIDSDNQRLYNIKQMLLERRKQAFEVWLLVQAWFSSNPWSWQNNSDLLKKS